MVSYFVGGAVLVAVAALLGGLGAWLIKQGFDGNAAPRSTGIIRGDVRLDDQADAAGVEIEADPGNHLTTSDRSGNYKFEQLHGTAFALHFRKVGYHTRAL